MCCKGVEESWGRGQSGRRGMSDTGTGVYSWDLNQRADPRADPVSTETKAVIEAMLLFGERWTNVTQLIWITYGCLL